MRSRLVSFAVIFFSIILITPQAFATHQDEASSKDEMVEVSKDPSTGQEVIQPEADPILQVQPEGREGRKLEKTTEDKLKELEKRMKAFEATTVTREEVTGHVFNYFKGFEFRFGITGVLQNSFRNDGNSPQGDQLDGRGTLDLVIARQFFDHGLGLVHFEAGAGNGLNQISIFNALLFGQVNRDAAPQARRLEVPEAYYEGNY